MRLFWQRHSLLIMMLALAIGLRLPQLNGSLWLDEAAQALESARPWSQQLNLAPDFHPPLLHLLLFLPIRLSHQEWWLRTVGALLPALVTIWAAYQIGLRLIGKRVGVTAALFLATSSFHIFYSQELRPYSLPAMWALISWLHLIKVTQADAEINSKQSWRWFTISSILGFYSSYLYPFLWLSQAVWMMWQYRSKIKKFALSAGWITLSFLPWLPSFLEQLSVGQSVRAQLPGWETVVSIPQLKAPLLVLGKFLFGIVDLKISPIFIDLTLLLSLLFAGQWYFHRQSLTKTSPARALKLLATWLIIPSLTSWLVSFFVPIVRPKRVLFLLPALYLFLALVAHLKKPSIKSQATDFLGWWLIALLLVINLFTTLQYHLNPHYQRENWRGLYQQISHAYHPSESILVFSFPEPFAPWRWYDQAGYPTLSTGQLHTSQVNNLPELMSVVTEYKYVLLFDYLRDLTDPQDQLRTELWALGFREIDALDYPQLGFVRVFSRTRPTARL